VFFQRLIFSYLLIYDRLIDPLLEWSGINALLYYGPTLVRSIGMRGDTVPLLVAGGIPVFSIRLANPHSGGMECYWVRYIHFIAFKQLEHVLLVAYTHSHLRTVSLPDL